MRRVDRHLNEDGSPKRELTRKQAIAIVRRAPAREGIEAYRCGWHWHTGHRRNPLERREVMVRREVSPDPWLHPRPIDFGDALRVLWRRWVRGDMK